MKAISIRNPYAHFILTGQKEFEYRTWQTDYRGDLLICSSASPKVKNTIMGHALCIVRLDDIFEVTAKNYKEFDLDFKPDGKLYAWSLTDLKVIYPFPVKGKLNFFEVDDSLIKIFDDGESDISDEEAQAWFDEYFAPKMYTGKR